MISAGWLPAEDPATSPNLHHQKSDRQQCPAGSPLVVLPSDVISESFVDRNTFKNVV